MNLTTRRRFIFYSILSLTVVIFTMGFFASRGVSDWVWYFIPLLLSGFVRNRRLPLFLAGTFSILILISSLFVRTGEITSGILLLNRCMAICVFWLVAWILWRFQQTEENLRLRSELLDLAHDAILVRDLDDRIVYWNKSAERIYGWTAEEAMGKKAYELLRKDMSKYEEVRKIVMAKGDWDGELICRAKDGRGVIVDARWTLVRDGAGNPTSFLSLNTNITDKKELEQQLLRIQRLESIGTLAGGIAHDLNNILAPVIMSLNLFRDKIRDDDTRLLLNSLETNLNRAKEIVKQVLAFGRGTGGERIAVSPVRILREVEKIVRETFPKSIQFETDIATDIWAVIGDHTQLYQVLLNLCVNARDAMPNGGRLSIEAKNVVLDEVYVNMHMESKPGPHVIIKVSDTGCGIPPELQAKIFEPFFTTKAEGQGTGLGLSTVMAIIKSHGGFINLYSEVNKGSAFKVYLPARTTQESAENAAIEQTKLPRGNNELILLVDDEENVRLVAKKVLERFGYRVLLAENGAAAVSLYAQQKNEIMVVITDMAMPIMDGLATIIALKAINPAIKIIASSGMASNGDMSRAAAQGVQHFIHKPYTAEAMMLTLQEVLQHK